MKKLPTIHKINFNSKLQMCLLMSKSAPFQRLKNEELGLSLPAALLIFFVVLLAAVSIANYTTSGLFAAAFQTDNREARDTAESGMAEVVSELNKEPNRRLLVAGNQQYTSTGWDISSDGGLSNECTSLNLNGTITTASLPTFNFAPGISNARRLRGDTTDRRRYYIESISYLAQSSGTGFRATYATPDLEVLSGIKKSFVRITVVGLSSNGGRQSKSRLAREFEVVPKCCKRSFGLRLSSSSSQSNTFYGNDRLSCLSDSRGGNGLIVGLNNGGFSGSGNTFDIVNDLNTPITQARCWSGSLDDTVTSTNTACTGGTLTIGSSITASPTDFDYVIPNPPPATLQNNQGCSNIKGNVCIDEGPNNARITRDYIKMNNARDQVEACKVSGNALSECLPLSYWGGNCQIDNQGNTSASARCRLTRIDLNGRDLIIDSSNGPINLYFDNPSCNLVSGTYYQSGNNCSTASPAAHNFLDGANGNGTITHVYCATSSATCNSPATLPESNRLNFYIVDQGYLKMKGRTSAVAINIYAPYATVGWAGGGNLTPNFLGRIWTHKLELQGNISMQVERTNPPPCTPSTCPPEVGGLNDYKLRNYTQSSGF